MTTYPQTGNSIRTPLKAIEDLSLQEITRNYLCGKAQGKVSVCMKCQAKCAYGKRAIELTIGPQRATSGVPYEGSMLQKARADAKLSRSFENATLNAHFETEKPVAKAEVPEEKKEESAKKKRKNADPDGWFEESLLAPDQIAWVMEKFGKSRTQARKKIYMYKYLHPEAKELKVSAKNPVEVKEEPVDSSPVGKEEVCEASKEKKMETLDDVYLAKVMERKLESLMNQQESLEAEIKKYREEYERQIKEPNEKLLKVRGQIDVLCKTMDILKE